MADTGGFYNAGGNGRDTGGNRPANCRETDDTDVRWRRGDRGTRNEHGGGRRAQDMQDGSLGEFDTEEENAVGARNVRG